MLDTTFLHIGPHKTASTAIQSFLTRHEDTLRSQGLHILESHRSAQLHNRLVKAIQAEGVEAIAPDIKSATSSLSGNLIISSEEFVRLSDETEKIAPLLSLLKDISRKVTVVAFTRPQSEVVNSFYGLKAKQLRNFFSIEEYADRLIDSNALDPNRLFGSWLSADEAIFLPYSGTSAIPDFLEAVNCRIAVESDRTRSNETLGPEYVFLSERISRFLNKDKIYGQFSIRDLRILRNSMTKFWENLENEKYFGLSLPYQEKICGAFLKKNETFLNKYHRYLRKAPEFHYATQMKNQKIFDPSIEQPERMNAFFDRVERLREWLRNEGGRMSAPVAGMLGQFRSDR